jgi:hypothetical protein
MVVKSGGNVGIGTSPSAKLTIDVGGGSSAPTSFTTANSYIQLGTTSYNTSGAVYAIGFGYTGGASNSPAYIGLKQTSTGSYTKGDLVFLTRDTDATDTAPTERMRITSDGSLQAQADSGLPLQLTSVVSGGSELRMRQSRGSIASPSNSSANGDGNYLTSYVYASSAYASIGHIGIITGSATNDGEIQFSTASSGTVTERARITSGGQVCIGTTNTTVSSSVVSAVFGSGSDATLKLGGHSGTHTMIQFLHTGTVVGSVSSTTSATSYNTSSDYRLKENVVSMTDALDRVSQLKPSRFNFKADAQTIVDGFLAHEVQDIVPEAITGEKDAMQDEEYEITPAKYKTVVHPAEDAVYETIEHPAIEEELDDEGNVIVEGQEAYTEEKLITEAKEEWSEEVLESEAVMGTRQVPNYQGIDQSKLVPLLVGAIQELKAEIDELKNKCNCN